MKKYLHKTQNWITEKTKRNTTNS